MIREAEIRDIHAVTELALLLWPGHEEAELQEDLLRIMAKEDAAFFLSCDGAETVGFAQCQLRHDYVEGTDSSPVGYLEGIYVLEEYRKRGVAKKLLAACETWARERGCSEFASDCEMDNTDSLKFHLAVGFEEANRIICFAKKI